MFVAGLAALVVLAFIGYLAIQLLRYAEVTPVSLTQPANVFSTIDAETTVIEGDERPRRGDHDSRPRRRAVQHHGRRGRRSGPSR